MAEPGLTHGVWLERIPELVRECVGRWELRLGEPYVAGAAGYTVRVELRDGAPAVLKLIYRTASPSTRPRRSSCATAPALLAHDSECSAMLLERCEPGTPLSQLGGDGALNVIAGLTRHVQTIRWLMEAK